MDDMLMTIDLKEYLDLKSELAVAEQKYTKALAKIDLLTAELASEREAGLRCFEHKVNLENTLREAIQWNWGEDERQHIPDWLQREVDQAIGSLVD